MAISRRSFLESSVAAAGLAVASPILRSLTLTVPDDQFDPWIEVSTAALHHNVAEIQRLTNGRPILAVIKNNGYGLGVVQAAQILEPLSGIHGFAVVKADAAFALREAGIRKPVHLMARFPQSIAAELAQQHIQPCLFDDDALDIISPMHGVVDGPVQVQVYLDTGMSRMGIQYHKAMPWLQSLAESNRVAVQGAFMGFTEEPEFDRIQLDRFLDVATQAKAAGIPLGTLHAASSSAVFEFPDAHLDMVRPGMALYGGYPNDPITQEPKATLQCAIRLKARVVRVTQLRAGDSVSYGRRYVAEKPTWVATLPAGHVDGMPRKAVEGGRVLIGERTYPVIGAVSASHTIIEVGPEPTVQVGDVATLMGPDAPEVNPNWISTTCGVSIYDLFMHLNASLPRFVA